MAPAIVRKSSLTLSALAILAIAGAEIVNGIAPLAVAWAPRIHNFLSGPHDTALQIASVTFVIIVLFLAGVVSGLAGFAFSAVAACVLWLLPPLQAVPLIMLLSACNQLLSMGKLRQEMVIWSTPDREGAMPYILGGLVGVPIGVELLRGLSTTLFAAGLGAFLVVYSLLMLLMPSNLRIASSGWKMATAVGMAGGVVGGFSGFGASMPVVYLGLRGLGKSATRGITQPYIFTMQLASLGVLAVGDSAIFNINFWFLWALTLPVVLFGSATGVALYRRLSDGNFRHAVLILLIVSGASLVVKSII
jgi:uncharacterized membrane protein YfcA